MQFSHFQKPMFTAALAADRQEALALIDFVRFLYEQDIAARLLADPLGPSEVWTAWAAETYVGFSSTAGLLLRSGHRFSGAKLDERPSRLPWKRDKFDPEEQRKRFAGFYPDYKLADVHRKLLAAHPGAFWRAAEAFILSGERQSERMLEIGAGNAVHVAYRHLLNPSIQTVIIDLPESMFAGYALLRSMGIDVALPHEDRSAAVTMRLPFQSIEGQFDFAFNMSSFQEMRPETVQGYLQVIAVHLAQAASSSTSTSYSRARSRPIGRRNTTTLACSPNRE